MRSGASVTSARGPIGHERAVDIVLDQQEVELARHGDDGGPALGRHQHGRGVVHVRAEHQDTRAAVPCGRRQRVGQDAVPVHGDGLQMLSEPAGEVAQTAVAQRLGQNRIARACQGQQRRGQPALGAVGRGRCARARRRAPDA